MKTLIALLFLSSLFFSSVLQADEQRIRLATTTSTDNSGLLNKLLPAFSAESGFQVHVIAVGTGKALRLGRDGDVDVVLVHAPDAEKKFVTSGYGVKRFPVMYNDFVIVGPANDPAGITASKSVSMAFQRISKNKVQFISRGDNSGTHKKELSIWKSSGLSPAGKWYREVGQGMGKVLQMANELNAYTLTDRGTWLAYQNKTQLRMLFEGDDLLHNPYGIIAVDPARYPEINFKGASRLIDWITDKNKGQKLIGEFKMQGKSLFKPMAEQALQQ